MADAARGRSDGYREAAGMLGDTAARPMTAWQRLRDLMSGSGQDVALDEAVVATERLDAALEDTADAASAAGAAGKKAGADTRAGAEQSKTGWEAVIASVSDYAKKAREVGADIGNALVSAFNSAEQAIGEFVKTGKLDFRELTISIIADLAKIGARKFILGPIANALSGALGNMGGIFANVFHAGGLVGGPAPSRMVPAMAFANAPRMHGGGMTGLRHDEVPAILQRGERVLSRRETVAYDGNPSGAPAVNVTINARDAESFRQSRTQIAADISRAVALGRRNL
ncbi:phage tail tape measure C-terminal domain-containing protein [Cognatishimia sp. F0-27]|uniref:phage tail tape measure C-terminal domain-containing protein n=1 Tax=Cognatishimia sp. F0-27 TaxID=2816855 RepID=UPI001DE386FF|nr:hypothetical protein [Cognatishimia sp. F0-27]